MPKFPHYLQPDAMDCGPVCLRIVAKYFGRHYNIDTLRELTWKSREGVSLLSISDAAEKIGFRTQGVRITAEKLQKIQLPAIIHWAQNHFVVLYKIKQKKRRGKKEALYYISDPGHGLLKYSDKEFIRMWASSEIEGVPAGIALLMEPTSDFYIEEGEKVDKKGFQYLFSYLRPYKKLIVQLLIGFLTGSVLSLIFPFLTQAIVDIGISTNNLSFIVLVLIAQLVLTLSHTAVDFIRSWIMLHTGTRVSISLISDFLIKLMKLPVRYFDTRMIGDIRQRIDDNQRIRSFLTGNLVNMSFGIFIFIIYSFLMAYYNRVILAIFYAGAVLYILWILLFLKKRKELDYRRFRAASDDQGNLYQLITGIQEIKLNNCEKQKRWEWERIQARLFKINVKGLMINQKQQSGSIFINQVTNILISFLAAREVIDGNMTLGMMVAIHYILGQLNSPVNEFVSFIRAAQDAGISLERLGEIHRREEEEGQMEEKIHELPQNRNITITNLSFYYEGPRMPKVLNGINLAIPENKITAIVGVSGSGKTTLIKMLLGFYPPFEGKIEVGGIDLQQFSMEMWRSKCGAVMQDGFIFSDTILGNITVADHSPDKQKLKKAVKIANIEEFIEGLPLRYKTKIGQDGMGLSQGQKQRMLIARAVYKNPHYILFDEATNALDAGNEKVIMNNLSEFFKGRTVLIVAHRLSTVKNADNIVVLDNGNIAETGTHRELTIKRGIYYNLIKDQLELGN